ncbi:glycoside hydrolase family 3 N-terminal domain-containing protein [Microbacterium sp. GXF7504]
MTPAEKLAQLQIIWRRDDADAAELARRGIGALFWPQSAACTNALQRVAVEESRLGIPLLIGLDVVHGQFTIFPTPLAQAASFDPAVAVADARVSAAEARSGGVTWTFSPMVDVTRDPRWGRVVEGFGEDPLVSGVFGAAKVAGYQGDDLAAPDAIAACLKHFVAYGAAEGGRDYNTADMSRQRLREVYLEPFRAGVEAGAASVMASFNTLNGTPMHANRRLLTDVLKTEYGFTGPIVADAEGVAQLVPHGVAADEVDAVVRSVGAGLDVVMGGVPLSDPDAAAAVLERLDPARVDDAVLRMLRLKERLGLFERPYVDEAAERTAPTPETLVTAREAAERCPVLLQNAHRRLPLPASGARVLLTGPFADSTDHLGAWVQHFAAPAGSLADALRSRLPELDWVVDPAIDPVRPSADGVARAARLATDCDLVVVAAGEPSTLSGEAASRSDIRLPGDQEALIRALAATGVPVVVLLATGRPLVVEDWVDEVDGLLVTWHLGTQGPEAIARVLAGDVSPAGRLPMSFPRSVGQIPVHHDALPTGRPARTGGSLTAERVDVGLNGPDNLDDVYTSKYLDLPLGPRFAFGEGLSYTTFELTDLRLDRTELPVDELRAGGTFTATVTVTNTGDRDADDVLQLFVRMPVSSLSHPVRRLAAFGRVHVPAGSSRTVALSADARTLFRIDDDERQVFETGRLEVAVTDGTTTLQDAVTLTVR